MGWSQHTGRHAGLTPTIRCRPHWTSEKNTKMGKINTLDLLIYDFYGILKDLELDIRPVDRTRMDADPASGGVRGHCMGGFSAESWMIWMVLSTFDVPVLVYAVYPV